jgi:hypothetical protein
VFLHAVTAAPLSIGALAEACGASDEREPSPFGACGSGTPPGGDQEHIGDTIARVFGKQGIRRAPSRGPARCAMRGSVLARSGAAVKT